MKRPGGFERGADPEEPDRVNAEEAEPRGLLGRFSRRSGEQPPDDTAPPERGAERAAGRSADDGTAVGRAVRDAMRSPESAPSAATVDLAEARLARSGAPSTELTPASERVGVIERARERFRSEPDPVRAAGREVRRARRRRKRQERREQRRFSVQARRRRRNWLIALGAVGVLALTVVVGVFTPLMAVQDIRVDGASQVSQEEIEGALERFSGVPLALVEDREIHRALEPFPLIQRYGVERVPPHTLVVRIEERTPVLAVDRDDRFELYDPAGVLLDRTEERPEGVPLATDGLSNVASETYASAATVLRDMPADLRSRISSASATSAQNLSFDLDNGIEVIWGEATKTNRKVEVLESMLSALADKDVEVIDVSSTEGPVFR